MTRPFWRKLVETDQLWSSRIRLREEHGSWFQAAAILAHSGDSWFWLAGLGLVWLFGSPEWRQRTALLILGIVFLAVMVLLIKFRVRRQRPEGDWGIIYRATDPHSFPSGHASRAAMLAVVALGIGPTWFALLIAFWAPLVSVARVMMGVHYLSDIVAGLVIGVIMGVLILLAQPLIIAWLPFLF
ncbi:MAG: phosphatase PAP2 family protein [Anaerolineaceae bacterium]|nr:phosphatase PAP2 family protein [Anaerolineaceae bacterium]